jgi:hypothetical protein
MTARSFASPTKVGLLFLGAVLVVTLSLIASHGAFVPPWDGRIYADCIVDAALQRLSPATMRCGGHPTHAYMLYAGAIQLLSPESFWPMLLANSILYVLSVAGVYRLARLAFPGDQHAAERALLTTVFAAQPAVIASVVQPNVDLPLLPAILWATVWMIRRRWLLVVILGTMLAFTKETGVLLYATLIAAYAVAMILPRPSSPRSPTRTVLRLAPLSVPLLAFVAYVLYRQTLGNQPALWNAGSRKVVVFQFLFPRIDQYFVNYLAMMFVLSFAWITTIVLVIGAGAAVIRAIRRAPAHAMPGVKRRVVRFMIVLGLATMYVLSRYSTWGNPRYLLPVMALTPLMVYAVFVRFRVPPNMRQLALVVLVLLNLVSVVRSVDPVSRATYGTFAVGEHQMFRMTGVSRECCGAGRDQLVYNLQFTALGDLASDATASMATDSTVIFLPRLTRWFMMGTTDTAKLDATTHRRTLRREDVAALRVFDPDTLRLLATAPSDAMFIALPNGDPDEGLRALASSYDIGPPQRMRRGGYWLSAYRLTLRDGRGT